MPQFRSYFLRVILMVRRVLAPCLLSAIVLAGCSEEPPKVGPETGNLAPSLEGTDTAGKRITLADCQGKVVLVDFWATWCGPCVGMIPHEKSLHKRMQGRPLVFIGISDDQEKDKLLSFIDKEQVAWSNIFDGMAGPITKAWKVDAFPTMFIIDAKGIIRYKFRGAVQLELDNAIDKLLSETENKS